MEKHLIIDTAEPFFLQGGHTGCVLVHGFTGSPKEMRLMGDALNQKGLTVVGVRLAGHATSPEDLIRMRRSDWLASVEDGFHYLSGFCKDIFLAGLSLGGVLSLVSAPRLNVSGVIAMSAPYELPKDWRLNFAKPLSALVPWIDKGKSDLRDRQIARGHVHYPAYPTRGIAEVYALTQDLHAALPKISKPVLLVYSRGDQTVPVGHAEKIRRLLGTDKVETLILEDSGHVVTEDIQREKVFEAAIQFIEKVKTA